MKLFRFSDYHDPWDVCGNFVAEGENLYYYFNSSKKFIIRKSARGYWLSSGSADSGLSVLWDTRTPYVFSWDVLKDEVKTLVELPRDERLYSLKKNLCVYLSTKRSITNPSYTIWDIDTDTKTSLLLGRGGSVIDVKEEIICCFNPAEEMLIGRDYAGNNLWSRRHERGQGHISAWSDKSKIIESQRTEEGCCITIIDLYSGTELLNYETKNMWIMSCHFDGDFAYIRCINNLIVYDVVKNEIVNDIYSEVDISAAHTQGDRLYILTEKPITLSIYNKLTFEKLTEKQITTMNAHAGSMASIDNTHMLAIRSDVPEESRGFTWICYFRDDELFADEWYIDIEPAYYKVEEQDDFSGGVSLNVSFDNEVDFDTLYRHVSIGLQTAAFRNGIHPFTEGKSYNERFNGTVVANFEGHDFTDVQRDLIEDLCERTTQYLQEGMRLLSGDGVQACYVTSIIPTTLHDNK